MTDIKTAQLSKTRRNTKGTIGGSLPSCPSISTPAFTGYVYKVVESPYSATAICPAVSERDAVVNDYTQNDAYGN